MAHHVGLAGVRAVGHGGGDEVLLWKAGDTRRKTISFHLLRCPGQPIPGALHDPGRRPHGVCVVVQSRGRDIGCARQGLPPRARPDCSARALAWHETTSSRAHAFRLLRADYRSSDGPPGTLWHESVESECVGPVERLAPLLAPVEIHDHIVRIILRFPKFGCRHPETRRPGVCVVLPSPPGSSVRRVGAGPTTSAYADQRTDTGFS
jgi:hypothetical protein